MARGSAGARGRLGHRRVDAPDDCAYSDTHAVACHFAEPDHSSDDGDHNSHPDNGDRPHSTDRRDVHTYPYSLGRSNRHPQPLNDADSDIDRDAATCHFDEHPYAYGHAYGHTYCHGHLHSDQHADSDANPHRDSDAHADSGTGLS